MIGQLAAAAWSMRRVAANADIRRAEAAWMVGWAAEWSWLVALFVYAYGVGGLASVGAVGLARTLPAAILAPMLSGVADRLPRHRVLLGIHAGRFAVIGLAALGVLAGWPPLVVLGLAPLDGLLAVLHRPAHMAMMPSLARSPEDLVAANVASSMLEAIGVLLGPMIGGALVATAVPGLTFVVPALAFGLAAVTVLRIQPARLARREARAGRGLEMLLGGIRVLGAHRHAALLLGLFGLQTLVRGILSVLLVITAVQLLTLGEQGVGYLNAAIGAGGFLGALAAMTLVGGRRLAAPVFIGLVLWGLPIMAIGLVPVVWLALVALAVLGAGNAVLDIAGFTLLQRTLPNDVRGRVFGLLEAIVMLTVGLGSITAPILVALAGSQGALVLTGLLLPLAAVLAWPALRRTDERAVVPARELGLLRRVPMLALLPLTVLEEVATDLRSGHHPAGTRVISQGEAGDRFYIIAEGEAEATVDGRIVRRLGTGDSFGEIALLREVPRTASVTAVTDLEVLELDGAAFVAAVTGDRHSLMAAEGVIDERLAVKP